jgi:ketosteroid isomerase-like protein
MKRGGLQLTVKPEDILIRGDLAFIRGTILLSQTTAGTNETKPNELRYLEIAERVRDGWQVIWGMDGPVQEYTPDG